MALIADVAGSLGPAGTTKKARDERRYCCVILTSSTPASTSEAVPVSAASMTTRTVWPACAVMLPLNGVQTPLRLTGAPETIRAVLCVAPTPITLTRKKSALEEFEPWAR